LASFGPASIEKNGAAKCEFNGMCFARRKLARHGRAIATENEAMNLHELRDRLDYLENCGATTTELDSLAARDLAALTNVASRRGMGSASPRIRQIEKRDDSSLLPTRQARSHSGRIVVK
jgi:hypothetical protein